MNFLKKIKKKENIKKRKISKKFGIIISSVVVFLNCFLWKHNSKICQASTSEKNSNFKDVFQQKFILGAVISELDSWVKSSNLSWQPLKTFLKQVEKKSFVEIKWKKYNSTDSLNHFFNHLSTLVEKTSEERKSRTNPRVQLEEVVFSGIKSYCIQNNFLSGYKSSDSKIGMELLDNTHGISKNNGFANDKFQDRESIRSLINYFPNLRFHVNKFITIPSDSGKGFTMSRFFSSKGSPFFKRILGNEQTSGFNVPLNSEKAIGFFIKDSRKIMKRKYFTKQINKSDRINKVETHRLNYSVTINALKKFGENLFSICWEQFDMNLGMKGEKLDLEMIKKLDKSIGNLSVESENSDNNVISPNVHFGVTKRSRGSLGREYKNYLRYYYNLDGTRRESTRWAEDCLKLHLPDYLICCYEQMKCVWKLTRHFLFWGAKFPSIKRFYKNSIRPRKLNELKKRNRIVKNTQTWNKIHLGAVKSIPKIFFARKIRQKTRNFVCFPKKLYLTNEEKTVNQSKKEEEKKKIFSINFSKILKNNLEKNAGNAIFFEKSQHLNIFDLSINGKKNLKFVLLNCLDSKTGEIKKNQNYEIFTFKGLRWKYSDDFYTHSSFLARFKYYRNPGVLNHFGELLSCGLTVPRSNIESVKYHQKASDLGDRNSRGFLGVSYLKGRGVKKCKKKAFLNFAKAAHDGLPKGVYSVANMLKNGEGVENDTLRALKILENSRNLLTKERKPFKKSKKINKTGFFKTLYSAIRFPTEISLINFFLHSFISPSTSYLGALIFERASLIASDINLTNLTEKKGSGASAKKLKYLFLENRQPYMLQETLKGMSSSFSGEGIESIFNWNMGIGFPVDFKLLEKMTRTKISNENLFHSIKIIENSFSILIRKLSYLIVLFLTKLSNAVIVFPIKYIIS